MSYFDPVAISFVSKSPDELQVLRRHYSQLAGRLWPRLLWCYLRNGVAALVAFIAVMWFALLGLLVAFRSNPQPGLGEWIVGLGWFFGSAYIGSKWKWPDQIWNR